MTDYTNIDNQILNVITLLLKDNIRPSIPKITARVSPIVKLFPVILTGIIVGRSTSGKLRIKQLVRYRLQAMKKSGQIKFKQNEGWLPKVI